MVTVVTVNLPPFDLKKGGKKEQLRSEEEEVFKKRVGNLPSHLSHRHQVSNDEASRGDGLGDGSFLNCHNRHLNGIYVIYKENDPCPKCGCKGWEIKVNPGENQGVLVFGICIGCKFERLIKLKDFEILFSQKTFYKFRKLFSFLVRQEKDKDICQ
jgi:hypothetical protein